MSITKDVRVYIEFDEKDEGNAFSDDDVRLIVDDGARRMLETDHAGEQYVLNADLVSSRTPLPDGRVRLDFVRSVTIG